MNYVSFKTSRNFCLGVVNIFYEWSNIIYRKLENMPLKKKIMTFFGRKLRFVVNK